jgi:hypothetical protein
MNSKLFWLLNGHLLRLLFEFEDRGIRSFEMPCSMNTAIFYISMTVVLLFIAEVSQSGFLMHSTVQETEQ